GQSSFGAWPWYMAQARPFVIPAALAAKYTGSDPIPFDEAIGSGPFTLTEWLPGNKVTYDRFDGYVPRTDPRSGLTGSREAFLDQILLLEVPDMNSRVAALRTGQVDFSDIVGNDFKQQLEDDPNTVVVVISPDHSPGAFINKSIPPTNNVKALQAIQLSINYADAMAAFGPPGTYLLGHQVFVIGGAWDTQAGIAEVFEDNTSFVPSEAMLAKARTLWQEALDETGFTGPIELMNATDLPHYGSLLVMKENMEAVGIEVDMPALDWATVAGRSSTECTWHLATTGWNAWDPISNPGFSDTWKCGWDNQEMFDMIDEFRAAATAEEQQALIDQIQIEKIRSVPYIHFGQLNALNVHRVEVKGYVGYLELSLDGLWLDR
ncbi:MAG: ABC transporter substrate-binding protein, partial [SAR202 cluster bacterium]|nr:ABC transporter substrate-binding protein [SAR202 cluster bacterium]